jgi:predicted nucleic acid-binding protein
VLVIDASALAPALGNDGSDGDTARSRISGERLIAPELIDFETASVFRRHLLAGLLGETRADQAMTDLADLPLHRVAHRHLLVRTWALRDNLTVYDASYVALAQMLGLVLVTGDARLSRAPGLPCRVELMS